MEYLRTAIAQEAGIMIGAIYGLECEFEKIYEFDLILFSYVKHFELRLSSYRDSCSHSGDRSKASCQSYRIQSTSSPNTLYHGLNNYIDTQS